MIKAFDSQTRSSKYWKDMSNLAGVTFGSIGYLGNATVNFRGYQTSEKANADPAPSKPTAETWLQLRRLREALEALKPRQISRGNSPSIAAQAASATSASALNLSSSFATSLQSVEEINTAPTSFQHNGPLWNGSTVTAPWSGLGSTADATVGGNYDGSNGQGILTFKVTREGTHGQDDLKIRVTSPDGSTIEDITINKNDPLDKVYSLSNGLQITLNAGDLVKNDTFEVDTSLVSTSYTPTNPAWTGSTANASIGGLYNGAQGSGNLKFLVDREGVHGQDDLRIRVYAPNDSLIDTINVRKNDAINKVYALSNGLTFSLGAGELIKGESFDVAVNASDPAAYTSTPVWNHSSVTPAFSGTYDGSNGTGTLTFKAQNSGVHGQDDLTIRVLDAAGTRIEDINIDKQNPINQSYVLSNGLSVIFSAGALIKNETFSIDVQAVTHYSTAANPVESTAEPAISGIYDGSLGTDTLTFRVTQEGIHGTDDLSFDVFKSDGTFLESISISRLDDIDQAYALSNGLKFSLGDGFLALNETFVLGVNHVLPTSVNPDLSFSGTGINDAKFEDPFTINNGTFEINGTTVDVFANDSINTVLERINNLGIDVTATFDVAAERIVLTRNTPGSSHDILLANDTSGFLAATKLSTAISVKGGEDATTPLANLSSMSSVSSGALQVNGVTVGFDVNVDSLEDVLSRIQASVTDVVASFDPNTGRVTLASTNSADLTISSGGTGFFAAVNINEGLYKHVEAKSGTSRYNGMAGIARRDTLKAMRDFSRRINDFFDDTGRTQQDSTLQSIRQNLKTAISEFTAPDANGIKDKMGIAFEFGKADAVFKFSDFAQTKFSGSLKSLRGATEFQDLFFGKTLDDEGLADRLLDITKAAEKDVTRALGSEGIFVDILV
jgi:hypothetical protein